MDVVEKPQLTAVIVEDAATEAHMLDAQLTKLGFKVVAIVDTADNAVRAYSVYRPNLITVDVTLKEGNGYDACARIRQQYPNANVVLVTSEDRSRGLEPALKAKVSGYVTKPISVQQLRDILQTLNIFPKL